MEVGDGVLGVDILGQSKPLVSVCVPAYRQEVYLKKLLDSLLIQDFTNFEVIITDDSPDDSVQQLAQNYLSDSRFRYLKNTTALGTPQNWNEAVLHAQGKYIKIMHHDDWLTEPYSLGALVKILEQHPESDFVFCATDIRNANSNAPVRLNKSSETQLFDIKNKPETLILGNTLGVPSATMYRRNTNTPVYDPLMKFLVDVDFYVACIHQNANIQFEPRALVGVGASATQVTAYVIKDKNLMLFEYFYFVKKHHITIAAPPYFAFFVEFLDKYEVRSLPDIRAAGVGWELPEQTILRMIHQRHFYGWESRFRSWIMAFKSKLK